MGVSTNVEMRMFCLSETRIPTPAGPEDNKTEGASGGPPSASRSSCLKTLIMKPTLVLFVSSLAAAAPSGWRERRQQVSLCGQSSSWSGNGYELNNNLWGQSRATSGSQCTYLDSSSDSGIHWHTTWTWEGGEGEVKSYAYSGRQVSTGLTIASIDSMQTSVSWEYNTTDIQANVAYDIFTAEDPDHVHSSGDYEVMIW